MSPAGALPSAAQIASDIRGALSMSTTSHTDNTTSRSLQLSRTWKPFCWCAETGGMVGSAE